METHLAVYVKILYRIRHFGSVNFLKPGPRVYISENDTLAFSNVQPIRIFVKQYVITPRLTPSQPPLRHVTRTTTWTNTERLSLLTLTQIVKCIVPCFLLVVWVIQCAMFMRMLNVVFSFLVISLAELQHHIMVWHVYYIVWVGFMFRVYVRRYLETRKKNCIKIA